MPAVTELAILRLRPTNQPPPATLLQTLNTAKLAMESSSGHPFTYLHCLEDPSIIYIVGAWPSVTFHKTNWIPSDQNQELLNLLDGQLTVDAMFHVDIDRSVTPIPTHKAVVAVARHHVKPGQREEFSKAFEHGRKYLDGFAGRGNVVGGWRIDQEEEGGDEFVLFTGWESKDQHLEFAGTEGFTEYAKIRDHLDSVEIMHARALDVSGGERLS